MVNNTGRSLMSLMLSGALIFSGCQTKKSNGGGGAQTPATSPDVGGATDGGSGSADVPQTPDDVAAQVKQAAQDFLNSQGNPTDSQDPLTQVAIKIVNTDTNELGGALTNPGTGDVVLSSVNDAYAQAETSNPTQTAVGTALLVGGVATIIAAVGAQNNFGSYIKNSLGGLADKGAAQIDKAPPAQKEAVKSFVQRAGETWEDTRALWAIQSFDQKFGKVMKAIAKKNPADAEKAAKTWAQWAYGAGAASVDFVKYIPTAVKVGAAAGAAGAVKAYNGINARNWNNFTAAVRGAGAAGAAGAKAGAEAAGEAVLAAPSAAYGVANYYWVKGGGFQTPEQFDAALKAEYSKAGLWDQYATDLSGMSMNYKKMYNKFYTNNAGWKGSWKRWSTTQKGAIGDYIANVYKTRSEMFFNMDGTIKSLKNTASAEATAFFAETAAKVKPLNLGFGIVLNKDAKGVFYNDSISGKRVALKTADQANKAFTAKAENWFVTNQKMFSKDSFQVAMAGAKVYANEFASYAMANKGFMTELTVGSLLAVGGVAALSTNGNDSLKLDDADASSTFLTALEDAGADLAAITLQN